MTTRQGYSPSVTITRPADTTPYTAGDVVGGPLTIGTFGPRQSTMMVMAASLMVNDTGVISGETSYRLHLYNVTPPSALADNTAWDLPAGDRASYLGFIDLGTPVDLGSTLWVETNGINKLLRLPDEASSVYGYLVTAGAYTPTSQRVCKVTLHAVV